MRDRPAGVGERDLRLVLAGGWRIHAVATQYAAVGGGSYHWVVRDGEGQRWFVTVDDLDNKGWLGETRAAVFGGLRAAMDTALALRRHAGLRFVVAPVPALDGETVRPLGPGYAVAVFPSRRARPLLDTQMTGPRTGFSARRPQPAWHRDQSSRIGDRRALASMQHRR